jgi:hypothetical protein
MMIQKLYRAALWARAVRREVYPSRQPGVPEREAFEPLVRALDGRRFARHRPRH